MNIADTAAIVSAINNAGGGGGGGGYDFIIKDDVTTSTGVLSLDKGDFEAVKAKILNHEMVTGYSWAFSSNDTSIRNLWYFLSAEYISNGDKIMTYWLLLRAGNAPLSITVEWRSNGEIVV